jgi:long-chain acyl-CoA synthetase
MTNFFERIAEAGQRFADRPAIEWVGNTTTETATYTALLAEAGRVAGWLDAHGIAPGDRVALLAANDVRWVAIYLGVLRHGAIAVPLDTAYAAPQVAAVLSDSGARILVSGDRYLEVAREAASTLPAPPRVVTTREPGAAAAGSVPPMAVVSQSDTAVLLYTSGTTADPKGVVLTHGNLDAERESVLAVVRASHEDVVLGVLPLFHALAEMANLWLPLSIGARVVFLDTVNSTTLLDALQTRGVTILACVPQFFYLIHQRVVGEIGRKGRVARLLFASMLSANHWLRDRLHVNPGRRIFARVHRALGPRMRLLITGGSRFDPDIARDLYGLGVSLYNGYGLTETSGAATLVHAGDLFTTSVGPPLPGVEIRIAPNAAATDDGEILIRGPIVMREYYRRPEATAEAIQDGWLHTGDLGRLDDQGRLFITGRLKEIIVLASGKNLYPEEIEAHYRQSPFIKELCVMGLARPGEPAAERLHAVVAPDEAALREKGIVNVRELIRFEIEGLSVRLPAHKRILTFEIAREPLARTSTGKLRRAEIAQGAARRSAQPDAPRDLSPDERAWIQVGDRAEMIALIAARLDRPAVRPDDSLELDLGLDSMERVELLSRLENHRGVRVDPGARAAIFSVRQLVEAVEGAAPGAPATAGDDELAWDALLEAAPDGRLDRELARSKTLRAWLIQLILRAVLVACKPLLDVRVAGRVHIPPSGAFVVAPNHQTFLDAFVLAAVLPFRAFRQIFFVGAAEFFETPFMAWGARAINIVPVDPDANLVTAMQAAAVGLRRKKVLMLFPEGERTIDGTLKPFRKGAAILASHLDVPVMPVAIDGLFPLWPRGRAFQWHALFTWRRRVTIAFAPPISVARGDYARGTTAIRDAVANALSK